MRIAFELPPNEWTDHRSVRVRVPWHEIPQFIWSEGKNLTNNVQVSNLRLHRVRVDLTLNRKMKEEKRNIQGSIVVWIVPIPINVPPPFIATCNSGGANYIEISRLLCSVWPEEQQLPLGNILNSRPFIYHVPSLVRFFDISNFQLPGAFLCVCDHHSMIFGDYVRLNRQNRLSVDPKPCNLWTKQNKKD